MQHVEKKGGRREKGQKNEFAASRVGQRLELIVVSGGRQRSGLAATATTAPCFCWHRQNKKGKNEIKNRNLSL